MAAHIQDELAWSAQSARPELYSQALVTWAGLGDLVHDSPDPLKSLSEGNMPVIDHFLVYAESGHERAPLTNKKIGSHTLHVSLGSWAHLTRDDQQRPHLEQRFSIRMTETSSSTVEEHTTDKEFLVGQGCVRLTVCTEVTDLGLKHSGQEAHTAKTLVTTELSDAGLVQSVAAILRAAPRGEIASRVAAWKKQLRETYYDGAADLHDIQFGEASHFGILAVEDSELSGDVRRLRTLANTVQRARLPIMAAQQHRLYDLLQRHQDTASR